MADLASNEQLEKSLLLVGCGYLGQRLLQGLAAEPLNTRILLRNAALAAQLSRRGFQTILGDLDRRLAPSVHLCGETVIYLAPPSDTDVEDVRLAACLERLCLPPRHLIYASTTAVYGDCGTARVDETSPTQPVGARGKRRLHAERLCQAFADAHGAHCTILRIAGIYGPGRLPLDALRQGEAVPAPALSGPGNRVQVDDLVAVLRQCVRRSLPGIFNLADGYPVATAEFRDLLADLLNLPRPPRYHDQESLMKVSASRRDFLSQRRRVDGSKILTVLTNFSYRTPAQGLHDALAR